MPNRKFTVKEQAFIDEYVKSGNATQSYINAGYKEMKDRAHTSSQAIIMLHKPRIAEEIQRRIDERHEQAIADGAEVMRYFTAVMRGEVQDQFGLDAPLSERTKAAQELARRTVDIENRLAGKEDATVTIKLDWSREE